MTIKVYYDNTDLSEYMVSILPNTPIAINTETAITCEELVAIIQNAPCALGLCTQIREGLDKDTIVIGSVYDW